MEDISTRSPRSSLWRASPERRAPRALTLAAERLREVLTRGKGVDGHEVLEVMVTSLDVRLASRANTSGCVAGVPFSPPLVSSPRVLPPPT